MFSDTSARIRRLFSLTLLAFLALVGWQSYWHLAKSDWLMGQPTNRRLMRAEATTPRGTVYDRRGVRLAWTEGRARRYADPRATAAVLGYLDPVLGRAGVEGEWNPELAGLSRTFTPQDLRRILRHQKPRGKDLLLTLDLHLQQAALAALGDRAGAIAVLEPASGAILALATSPTFSAATIRDDYPALRARRDGVLRNRAIQDHYAPGSTMKVVTAAAALMAGVDPGTTYRCEGNTPLGRFTVKDYGGTAHGVMDMRRALVKSCNYYFARTAAELPQAGFVSTAAAFGFGQRWWQKLPDRRMLPLPVATSSLAPDTATPLPVRERANMGFGQATVVATPLQMAMVAAAIGNYGTAMAPYLVSEVRKGGTGQTLAAFKSGPIGYPMDRDTARELGEWMRQVVTSGTGTGARVAGITVCGKTGTAQQEGGADHAWFIGFAERERARATERIAFSVIIERGGTGGRVAAPVARRLLEAWARE